MRKQGRMHQRLVVGELVAPAGLERASQHQRWPDALQLEHLQRLPARVLGMQSLPDAIALVVAAKGRLGKPVLSL
jgi:hypothetical protein